MQHNDLLSNLILPNVSCVQAYKSDVQRVLKTKADEETTQRQIGKKAAVADVREALATKADAADVKQALSAKAPNADFRALEARVAAVRHIRRFPAFEIQQAGELTTESSLSTHWTGIPRHLYG